MFLHLQLHFLVCYPSFGNAPIFFYALSETPGVICHIFLCFGILSFLYPRPHYLEVNSIYETEFLFFHICVLQITALVVFFCKKNCLHSILSLTSPAHSTYQQSKAMDIMATINLLFLPFQIIQIQFLFLGLYLAQCQKYNILHS